ncbi:serine/threonine-protein kinase, partial [Archangium sp.]|uniref:serine/threonine-protein kinase n=1 Tax=Archangium sp. TaxID=1872627 RepID=UPI002D2658DB
MWNELIAEMETQYSLPASSSVLLSERLREVIHQAFLSMLSGTASTPRLPGQGAPAALPPPPSSSAAEASLAPPVEFPARYEDLGLIGMGGMGEVRRVLDRVLQRQLAMKIIHGPSRLSPDTLARFMAEARITAQLEHPGIVPVHDLGTLPDGRAYFTMKEVQGRSFSESIREMHRSATQPPRWSLRRLVDIFLRICESMAYAHARGVIHRDLKPSNIMVGEFGEVVVVDWGVAGLKGHSLHAGPAGRLLPPVHAPLHEHVTLAGMILGTLSYMPVEQARGEVERLGFTADVYALGAILYEIISGHPPYTGSSWGEVLRQLLAGPPAPLSSPLPVPEALQEICARAMARNAEDRYPDAGVLASEVGAWLDGARRREQALAMVALAEQRWRESAALRAEAHAFESRARALLKQVPYHAPAEAKKPAWALQDRAAQLQQEASIQDAEFLRYVWASMTHVPELAEARALAADYFQRQHAIAEEEGDAELAVRSEELLRSNDDGRHAAYLQGHGALWLWTEPSGAEVELFRYRERDRLLVPEPVRLLGRTPLD